MKLNKRLLVLLTLSVFFIQSNAQTGNYQAYFDNTSENITRDTKDRLHMSYRIEGPQTQAEIDLVRHYFSSFGILETFTITTNGTSTGWSVTEVTKPGIKLKMHKKMFLLAGITTVIVNGNALPVATFRRKMVKNK